ncbi:LCP family protein [Actinacidiphila paucisporea]|uniref:Transcriptional attenuator, LytR family n=1 Tax=Actinacidiphila paucisporea TaxID=310782 RepID=A0A1M6X370_9ACTN|nr:LCP family protein [Actinacidiphila paucisporea]SHL00472.1 transcriptional attenuator, LytR family [Actinacidiphila paucisporea]
MNDANPRWQYAEGGPDDERDPYPQDPYYQQQSYGYDQYGNPVQQQAPPAPQVPQQPGYQDPYQTYGGGQGQQQGWIPQQPQPPYYEQQPPQQQPQAYDTGQQPVYDTGQHAVYDTGQHAVYGTGQMPVYETGQQPAYDAGQHAVYETGQQPAYDTGQQPVYDTGQHAVYDTGRQPAPTEAEPAAASPAGGAPRAGYQTEMFAFVDEESEQSEEVIDWLKFSESRTERREEAKRRGRNRKVGLVVVLVLALLGATGYLWQAGKLPGVGKSKAAQAAAGGPQKRDVIVVHLIPVDGGPSDTALLVDNSTKGRGTTVLLPNALSVASDDGTAASLDKSVGDGIGPTRDALNTLLGADIKGSWRLDSPYLELLVDALGDVYVDTDTAVKGTGKDSGRTLVQKGGQQELTGQAAVAYATYRAAGEPQTKQLSRFGQVMQAVLKKMPSDAAGATRTVQSLSQILDPSLTDKQLGASLAQLADLAKTGAYSTTLLPVQKDGTLSQDTDSVVKDVLGGTVKQSAGTTQARVLISDATGNAKAAPMAQAAIVNGGTYTYVSGGKGGSVKSASEVLYTDAARLAAAKDVAATLGLPPTAVKKGKVPANADIAVTLGKDYKLPPTQ